MLRLRPGHINKTLRFLVLLLIGLIAACSNAVEETDPPAGQYRIGGTVTGLTGSGLVLQNNDGDNLPVTTSTFTFTTSVTDGGTYDVTVLSQPIAPDQVCTITNGSGTVSREAVTNIAINCQYSIGGTVTGLSGSGLVLQNNAGDDLSITDDGAFTFSTAQNDGSSYDVTVLNQPTNLSQTCEVINGTGSLAGANITNINIDCNSAPVASNVSIGYNNGGVLITGVILTGTYTYSDVDTDQEGTSTYRWLRNGTAITGSTARTYTITVADIGQAISFEVTPVATAGTSPGVPMASTAVTINSAPLASRVGITGNLPLVVGTTLTGSYTYSDVDIDLEGISTYRWLRNGAVIAGATATSYTLTASDIGQAIRFEVTPVALIGTHPGTTVTSAAGVNVSRIGELVGGLPQAVAIQGDYAYVAALGILSIVDISNPANPSQIAYYDTGRARGVAISGNYAYLADGGGLRIIDISDPTVPAEVGAFGTPGAAYGVAISGNYAYVADSGSGLRIIDISVPTAPVEVGFVDTPGWARGVAISGNYAYVADYYSGLRIIDISVPIAPVEVGAFDTLGRARGIAIGGNYAYVADDTNGLRIIDISVPTAPAEVGFVDTPGWARGVAISGNYAYVADETNGLRIIDISVPTAPTEVGAFDTLGTAYDVAISGSYAYVADYVSGLRIFDISNPATSVEVGFVVTPGLAQGVSISGNYAYVADNWAGLEIYEFIVP